MAQDAPPQPRRGTLVLIVGRSGVGKDALIGYCRERLGGDGTIVFPRRVVTRRSDAGFEDHDVMSAADFQRAAGDGAFALHWHAHGLRYGIPAPVGTGLAEGRSVVVNVSRTVLAEARRRFPPLLIVSVVAHPDVIAARLRQRGRETAAEIAARLARAAPGAVDGPDVIRLDNSGQLEEAGEALLMLIREAAAPR